MYKIKHKPVMYPSRRQDMARKKVKLQWIMNDTARRTTYKKRVQGLMKKVKELSILCGVEACAIVYSPYDPLPEIWPPPVEALRVIGQFRCRPENGQTKKRLNQENYTLQRVGKAEEQMAKQQRKNKRMNMENIMCQCLGGVKGLQELNITDLGNLMWYIDDQLKEIDQKIEYFHFTAPQPGTAAPVAAIPAASKTALDVALESLENQMAMEIAPTHPGGHETMLPGPSDLYEDPIFWGPPFFFP